MREFREWGHKLIDWVADYLESPEAHQVLAAIHPNDIINALPPRGPDRGESMDAIFADFEQIVLPGVTHWNHPNFLAYFGEHLGTSRGVGGIARRRAERQRDTVEDLASGD